jgi:hypothetical protein
VGCIDGLALQVTATGARPWVLRLCVADRHLERGWNNAKHAAQRPTALHKITKHMMGALCGSDVTTARVMKVLEPRWATPAETARCIWPRREQVPRCATTRGLRKGRKQARRRGKLDAAPLKLSKAG